MAVPYLLLTTILVVGAFCSSVVSVSGNKGCYLFFLKKKKRSVRLRIEVTGSGWIRSFRIQWRAARTVYAVLRRALAVPPFTLQVVSCHTNGCSMVSLPSGPAPRGRVRVSRVCCGVV